MSIRKASHAGSWYTSSKTKLEAELAANLAAVPSSSAVPPSGKVFEPPIKGCKAVISPHAGYSYSGPAAAWSFSAIDVNAISTVFILGPSHHYYLNGCALSRCENYATPVGDLPLDLEKIAELRKTGRFSDMALSQDEEEHSIEMQLPYLRHIFQGKDIKIVPILVGSLSKASEAGFGALLAPHLDAPRTLTVVSSDFCHWGARFSYTYYDAPPSSQPTSLASSRIKPDPSWPIYKSIEAVDREGMGILEGAIPDASAEGIEETFEGRHERFAGYLKRTKNTICGRHPIGVLLGAIAYLEDEQVSLAPELHFVRYEQSSACEHVGDSSVSYAAGWVRW